jgi:CHAT domain-containing protein
MLDAAISSYVPTVAALAHARRPAQNAPKLPADLMPTLPPALVAAVSAPPGGPVLSRAAEEAELVAGLIPDSRLLSGASAHRDVLLGLLSGYPAVFHFSGHAVADPVVPSAGRLLAADLPLTVADVAALNLPDAHLAYLSACGTAHVGLRLPDEALHLANALQMAGYRHVVGTLWPVDDTESLERVRAFYAHPQWSADPALALHHAVIAARDAHPFAPSHWAGHVHSGT